MQAEAALEDSVTDVIPDPDYLLLERDPPEPPARDDFGDSEFSLSEAADVPPECEQVISGPVRLKSLPARLRLAVKFEILLDLNSRHLTLRPIGPSKSDALLQPKIAEVMVQHIERHLSWYWPNNHDLGDWKQIPAIGSVEALTHLVGDAQFGNRMHSIPKLLRNFAVRLPCGTVITPDALIHSALDNGRRATMAAALRAIPSKRPSDTEEAYELGGEWWSAEDIKAFRASRRKFASKKRKSVKSLAPNSY
jgi:hypothetical protein